uniref:GTP cyclohydrolase I n=1 Tax=Pyrodinium bahamense TaxID=73915 RepID=A0A7R9ZZZ2_9DINO
MPDVASTSEAPVPGTLDLVGMSHIEIPVCLRVPGRGQVIVPAHVDAYVDLVDPHARGIHMSRLYLLLGKLLPTCELSIPLLKRVVGGFLESHADRSRSASLRLAFQVMHEQASLKSANKGWRGYPVEIEAFHDGCNFRVWLTTQVTYSSTCPCSAALARQLIQERFRADFVGRTSLAADEVVDWLSRPEGVCATPHSQRSYATLTVELDKDITELCPLRFIRLLEGALKTSVQAAVKREDEQEFALINGQNMMFCEDAGRRMRRALDAAEGVLDFRAEARHVESLHPHDAVSVIVKGVPGGLEPSRPLASKL